MKEELIVKLVEMLLGDSPKTEDKTKPAIGRYVIVRSRNEGVNFGKVVDYDDRSIHIVEAQRLHSFAPDDKCDAWYEGVANSGISSSSDISMESEKIIVEDYSTTFCSQRCVESIKAHKPHEQN